MTWTVIDLGIPAGSVSSYAQCVNADGSVIGGGSTDFSSFADGVIWQSGTFETVGSLAIGDFVIVRGISGDGSIAVGGIGEFDQTVHAFSWTSGGGLLQLPYLGTGEVADAHAISNNGSVIVGQSSFTPGVGIFQPPARPVSWTGTASDLGFYSTNTEGIALCVDDDGSHIAGGSGDGSLFLPWQWTSGSGAIGVDTPGGPTDNGNVFAINSDGTVVAGQYFVPPTQQNGFIASSGTGTDVTPATYQVCIILGLSADGLTAVGYAQPLIGSDREPFIWTLADGFEFLPLLSGHTNGQATAISRDGTTIVGRSGPNGSDSAVYWRTGDVVPIIECGDHTTTGLTPTWTYAETADTYTLDWRKLGDLTFTEVTGITDLFLEITGLLPANVYEIKVKAVLGIDETAFSNLIECSTLGTIIGRPPVRIPLPPRPPSLLPPVVIPLRSIPSQTVTVNLNNQSCRINVRQTSTGVFLDLYVNDALIIGGVLCQNLNAIVRNPYLGFIGDLAFYDTQPSTILGPSDPFYTGLGSRFVLEYFQDAP